MIQLQAPPVTFRGDLSDREIITFDTELGWMAIIANSSEVLRLGFGHQSASAARRAVQSAEICVPGGKGEPSGQPLDLEEVADRLQRLASGEPVEFADIPVDLSHLTPFSREVASECRRLEWGETSSYGEIAERCGRPGAARAVGSVMAKNRIPLIIPCHRVLGAGGKLGGYSAPGGLATKRRLLDLESMRPV